MAMRRPVSQEYHSSLVFDALECHSDPKDLISSILNQDVSDMPNNEDMLWKRLYDLTYHGGKRMRIIQRPTFTDIDSIVKCIDEASKIVVILGAGGSVGPDFRSPGGLYDSIAKEGVFDDPCQVFDLDSFMDDPSIFWKFAHTIFPERYPRHSQAHYFLENLEKRGKLLRLYSQNVDALDVGIKPEHLRCVHGSWRESHCMNCDALHSIEDIREYVERGEIPKCIFCGGNIKPGIVFFGQSVNLNDFELENDAREADLLLVIGTSLSVAPVSEIPKMMKHVPSILINRATVKPRFSAELLGECDDVVDFIEAMLGWSSENKKIVDINAITKFKSNKFIFPSESPFATRVIPTTRTDFLATSVPVDVDDLA